MGSSEVGVDASLPGLVNISCRGLPAGFCDHFAQPIDGAEHLIETLRGALELAAITFAVKEFHCVFDGKIWSRLQVAGTRRCAAPCRLEG